MQHLHDCHQLDPSDAAGLTAVASVLSAGASGSGEHEHAALLFKAIKRSHEDKRELRENER